MVSGVEGLGVKTVNGSPIEGQRGNAACSRIHAGGRCDFSPSSNEKGAAPQRIANPARPRPLASVDHGEAALATLGIYARIPRMGFQR